MPVLAWNLARMVPNMPSIASLLSRPLLSVASLLMLPVLVLAQGSAVTDQQLDDLRSQLAVTLEDASQNQIQILALKRTPMPGMVEVELNTGELLYTDISGGFLFAGDMFQTSDTGLVNLTSQTRQVRTMEKVAAIPEEEKIIFSPRNPKASITVFTDVDCTYCRALHRDIEKLMDLGIEVKYVAYPRGGEMAGAYEKMVSVWCSSDRQKSLTQAKNGQNLPKLECDNPVLEHYALGNEIGISGTPALVLSNGQVIPGYMDPERLAATLLDAE